MVGSPNRPKKTLIAGSVFIRVVTAAGGSFGAAMTSLAHRRGAAARRYLRGIPRSRLVVASQ